MEKVIEEILVSDVVGHDCIRRVHIMRNTQFAEAWDESLGARFGADPLQTKVDIRREATGAWHLRAEWPYRGPLDVAWPAHGYHRLVVWAMLPGDRVSAAVQDAAAEFSRLFSRIPLYAYVRKLPRGVDLAAGIRFREEEILLFDAVWMMERAVAVGYAGSPIASMCV